MSDTDSLFLSIPEIQPKNAKDAVEKSEEIAEEINNLIIDCMNTHILPKMNVPGHNETFFKSELILESLLCTNKKKKYCFKEIANEGTIHKEPIVRYTGISVVRTNTAAWTKGFIKEIVEDVALNTKLKDKFEVRRAYGNIALKYKESLQSDTSELEFSQIGVPCKWGNTVYKRDTAELIGMKLYNTIFQDDYFKENTSGLKVPIKIKNVNDFLEKIKNYRFANNRTIGNTTIDKLTFLVVPIYHTKKILEPVLNNFSITIDTDVAWDKLVETTLSNIIDCIKVNHGLQK
ncbi:MAG: hypothetical protein H8D97_00485 [Proteobacteria bacterium]|nr:hypothetical protein [Pseudomonadota bacterium]